MAKILFDRNIERKSKITKLEDFSAGSDNQYYSKLIKLIPSEVIAFYLTLNALTLVFPVNTQIIVNWLTLILTIIGGLMYLNRYNNVYKLGQFIIYGSSILIWIYVIGGPFKHLNWYNQAYGEFVATIFTFFMPLIYNPKK